ncbi:MAG: phosphate ABC transporter permease subunit PstC [Hyphomicrobiaceae bacterium]
MTSGYLLLALIAASLIAYGIGLARLRATAGRAPDLKVHSRPGYYGAFLALATGLLPILVTLVWSGLSGPVIDGMILRSLPQEIQDQKPSERTLTMSIIDSVAEGLPRLSPDALGQIRKARYGFVTAEEARAVLARHGVVLGAAPSQFVIGAAYDRLVYLDWSRWLSTGIAGALALGGFLWGYLRIAPRMRARNIVEQVVTGLLIAASSVAILTTAGIVFSVLFETIAFFQRVAPSTFFFGTVWDPRFSAAGSGGESGQFGLLPLAWGTVFISIIALLVAVPVGLYAAIYMSEYASPRLRDVAKPLLEVLAGIPTIVYGFFALITFGPMLRDAGAAIGLDIAATSALSAGVVMGVMIIPFVSSLSDDIISAVPQSLREGSLGLGATKSETIRQVVLPAALPGIVGAVLLAASRAIGETMIVVLAAGIAANLTLNPFEPVTTMTVKIVSQLTGDLEFDSPQTLVAFALGLTLFVVTLGLNILALYIVRKYREQYE